MEHESGQRGDGREDPRSSYQNRGDPSRWLDEIKALSEDVEERDGDDGHVAVYGLHAELGQETTCDATGSILEISTSTNDGQA